MADLTLTTSKAVDLYMALKGVDDLTPPMTPKGRYVLAKAMLQLEPIVVAYEKARNAAAMSFAKRDEAGKVVSLAEGRVALEDPEGFTEAHEALLAKEVTITGTRLVTRAELGACPITQKTERVLLGVLLDDVEPA